MRKIWLSDGRHRGMEHQSYSNHKQAKRVFKNIQTAAYDRYKCTLDDINRTAECDIRLFWKTIKRQKPKQDNVYTK